MIDGVPTLTPAGHRRTPTKEMLACWLVAACNDGRGDEIMIDDVGPGHAAPVDSNDDDAQTSGDIDSDSELDI